MEAPVSHDLLARRATAIVRIIEGLRKHTGIQESVTVVTEEFVDGEQDAELRRLGEVLARARQQALIQSRLDEDREALHHGHLDHDEETSVGHHYEMLRHQACSYNHLLRGFIESCSQYISRDELMSWLTSASLGRAVWARGEITGAVSEIALHAALQGLPEIRELRYATVEEDLVGYDFVGKWQGKLLTIDAKTGFYQPLFERKHGHTHLEIAVPREAVKDLKVNHRGLALLRGEVRQTLSKHSNTRKPAEKPVLKPAAA